MSFHLLQLKKAFNLINVCMVLKNDLPRKCKQNQKRNVKTNVNDRTLSDLEKKEEVIPQDYS